MTAMRFVRTSGGKVLHRSDCRYAKSKTAVWWKWAEDKQLVSIWVACCEVDIHECSFCQPLADLDRGDT